MEAPPVLEIRGLTKRYRKITALDNLDLSIPKGSVYGLLGPNGSGKTTTLGIVLRVIRPNTGTFSWFPGAPASRHQVGAILETPNFYPYMSGWDNLRVAANIKGVRSRAKLEEKLELVELLHRRKDKFQGYSLGMKQRLAIASALINDPEVLILDEPTNGLDPQGIAEIRALIRKIAEQGTTILLASHLLDEVEKVCSHVAVLKFGKLLYSGPTDALHPSKKRFELSAGGTQQLLPVLTNWDALEKVETSGKNVLITPKSELTGEQVNRYCADHGIWLDHLITRSSSLEQQFLDLTSKP